MEGYVSLPMLPVLKNTDMVYSNNDINNQSNCKFNEFNKWNFRGFQLK
jgi:hypothetical protein